MKKGDAVAIGYSGSFPALNICVMAAVETLQLEPIGIASASASQWVRTIALTFFGSTWSWRCSKRGS